MHDIWNPWHGCQKKSEGCENCYMMFLDKVHGNGNSTQVIKTGSFRYPLSKNKDGLYKIKSGELIRVCMTSDFFVEGADLFREQAWEIIRKRSDVIFFLLTKRPERVLHCLPDDWADGYDNVFFNITCENQKRADERIPILRSLPFKHKGIMTAPLLGEINISDYLKEGFIEQVICGGENYTGCRPCDYDWVKYLSDQCQKTNTTFAFIETGTNFIKDHKTYNIPNKFIQTKMAYKSGLSYQGKKTNYILRDPLGWEIKENKLYQPKFTSVNCSQCGNRIICNGCPNCGKCKQLPPDESL
ncbi:MAG: DUF5131 family protein [Bacilli bacterium]